MEAAGIPLAEPRSLGKQGLALSKLPPELFRRAQDGQLEMGKALAIGQSGLDPENMMRVAAASENLSQQGTFELVQLAQTAPKIEADQGGLFGTEYLDTMAIKADLAARVRTIYAGDARQFGSVAKDKNAAKLAERANTQVDQGAAASAASTAEQAYSVFQAEKYAEGTEASRLLNEGVEDINAGQSKAAVARRVAAELAALGQEAPPAPKNPSPKLPRLGR